MEDPLAMATSYTHLPQSIHSLKKSLKACKQFRRRTDKKIRSTALLQTLKDEVTKNKRKCDEYDHQ